MSQQTTEKISTERNFWETCFRDWPLSDDLLVTLARAGFDYIGLYLDKERRTFKYSAIEMSGIYNIRGKKRDELRSFLVEHGYTFNAMPICSKRRLLKDRTDRKLNYEQYY